MAVFEPSQEQLALARRMAREGASIAAIREACGFATEEKPLKRSLRKHFGIKVEPRPSLHLGDEPTLSQRDIGGCMDDWRPRRIA